MRLSLAAIALLTAITGLPSCVQPVAEEAPANPYDYQLADGEYGIEPLPAWESAPDFSIGWQRRGELQEAAQASLSYLSKPSSQGFFPVAHGAITHDRMVRSVRRFSEVLAESASAEEFLQHLDEEFEVWVARGKSGTGDVFFTGYGTPILDGSHTQGGD